MCCCLWQLQRASVNDVRCANALRALRNDQEVWLAAASLTLV